MESRRLGLVLAIVVVMTANIASAEQWMFDNKPITATTPDKE